MSSQPSTGLSSITSRQVWEALGKAVAALGSYAVLGIAFNLVRRNVERMRAIDKMSPTVSVPKAHMHWIWGYVPGLKRNARRRFDWFMELYEACGNTTSILLPGPVLAGPRQGGVEVSTTDPANVKHVLKDNFDNYVKRTADPPFITDLFEQFIGRAIFLIDHGPHARVPEDGGKMWLHQRKVAATIVSHSNFQNFYQDVFAGHGRELISLLKKSLGEAVDIQDMFFKYTLDSFGLIGFNTDLKTLSPQPDPFGFAFDEAHRLTFAMFFESMLTFSAISLLPPGLKQAAQALWCHTSSKYQSFQQHISTMRQRVAEIIEEQRRDPNIAKRKDLLALFMNSTDEDGILYLEPSHKHDDHLCDLILNFMLAGRDTTACTLSWTIYELSRPENIAAKRALLAEIDSVLAGKEPTYADVKERLPYLRGVVYETLRLHPIVPQITLVARYDDCWPDGSFIAASTLIRLFVYGLCRSPKHYEEPGCFRPERWIPFQAPTPWDYPVFKGGPRICLGMTMAIFEASLLLAMLLQHFEPQLCPGQKPTYSQMATISVYNEASKKHELMVTWSERQKSS